MTTISWLKSATAGLLVALLAACGGGGGSAPANLPEVAWASPAVFVTPGASSATYTLESCSKRTYVTINNPYQQLPTVTESLVSATLRITSEGVVSVSGAVSPTGTVSTQWSMAFADARYSTWSVNGTVQTPTYYIGLAQESRGSKYLDLYSNATGGEFGVQSYSNTSTTNTRIEISCGMTTGVALKVNADQARAAKNLGTAAGVTTYDNYYLEGRIEGGKAFWADSQAMPDYTNLRFDLATGQLASSSSTTAYSTVSLALPSTSMEYGSYGETLERNSSFYNLKDAKTICLGYESSSKAFAISATAYDNKFMPRRGDNFMMPSGMESPQGMRGGCEDDR